MVKSIREITKSKARAPETGTPVLVRLQAGQLQQLDDWRRQESDLPSRAEAIRRLIAQALGGGRTGKK
jgi:hypothetical protein